MIECMGMSIIAFVTPNGTNDPKLYTEIQQTRFSPSGECRYSFIYEGNLTEYIDFHQVNIFIKTDSTNESWPELTQAKAIENIILI